MKNKCKALQIINLTKRYENFTLNNISFDLEYSQIVGLIGPNGAGKSTTLKSILGIIHPDSGKILIDNLDIELSNKNLYIEKIGYVGENIDYFSKCKLQDISRFYSSFYSNWNNDYYITLMNKLGLSEKYYMKDLSKGMRVKFSLCLALSHKPILLLMDEPTSGLDPVVRNQILQILKDYSTVENAAILFSSHITEDMEKIADSLIFIDQGTIIKKCSTQSICEKGISIDSYLQNLLESETLGKETNLND